MKVSFAFAVYCRRHHEVRFYTSFLSGLNDNKVRGPLSVFFFSLSAQLLTKHVVGITEIFDVGIWMRDRTDGQIRRASGLGRISE